MASFSEAYAIDKETGKRTDAGYRVCWRYEGKMYQRTVENRVLAVRKSAWITDKVNLIKQGRADAPPQGADIGLWFMSEGKQGLPVDKTAENGSKTITSVVEAYLATRKQEVASGNLAPSSYSSDVYRLDEFKRHCERERKSKLADIVTGEFLGAYRSKLLDAIAKGKTSPVSVKHVLRTVKACLKWAYKQEIIDAMPRVFEDYAKITLPTPPLAFYTVDEIQALYKVATPRVRLYMLLGLNLGYTQSDIATLEHGHIDWATNTVTRNRHKTGQPQLAKLWPTTAALLKENMTNPAKTALMLLGENGNHLVSESETAKGKPIKVDAIATSYARLKAKANMADDSRGFKVFRKTSAENIGKSEEGRKYPHLVDLFLGHTQKSMAKFYANPDFTLLFEETDKLATLYNLSTD